MNGPKIAVWLGIALCSLALLASLAERAEERLTRQAEEEARGAVHHGAEPETGMSGDYNNRVRAG